MSRSERIAQQLGMSQGAAAGKLRKTILFSLLVKLKENICFKCEKEITTETDLSIEHKKPWENRSSELFWDLDNIAFSHLRCNVIHTRYGGSLRRKIGPEGTSWCTICQDFLPIERFYKDRNRWDGFNDRCISCLSEKRKDYPSRKSLVD